MLETLTIGVLVTVKNPEPLPQPKQIETVKVEQKQETKKKKPKTIKHKVRSGETLSKIAKKHKTTVKRLYAKNKSIKHPDKIKKGAVLVIPTKNEKLKPRSVPKPKVVHSTSKAQTPVRQAPVASSTGLNGYYAGQCTGFVASKRYVPSGWGDATNWMANAQASGYSTGSTPKAGAIAWRPGHVAYVESVSGDMVTISEQNYDWNSGIRTITIPASSYRYIY